MIQPDLPLPAPEHLLDPVPLPWGPDHLGQETF